MFQRKEVEKILSHAKQMDPKYERFGVSRHQYKLNPPIRMEFVRAAEKRYHFQLPEDYVQFITEVGDGGAGPDYGIYPFGNFFWKAESPGAERFREEYRRSLANPFLLVPMEPDDVEYSGFSKEAYEKNPGDFFVEVGEGDYKERLCDTDGFYVLGTHGCQWDFGMVTAGERRGQVFDTDNEGNYCFAAHSFYEYYQNWLDHISDAEQCRKELEMWRKVRER